jgi:predicted porin
MKKSLIAALCGCLAAPVMAQSSVTLFGVIDLNARNVKNADADINSLSSNGSSSSRLGVRGVEDLGGGLRAGFWLEHGLNPDTGLQSDTRFWNRRATVSLIWNPVEIRLGRDFVPTYTGFADYDVFGTNGVADANKFNSRLGTDALTTVRADNQVSLLLPKGSGFYAQLSVAAGEGTSGAKYQGGRIGWAAGPLDLSAALGRTEVATAATGDDQFETWNVGASYNFGVMRVAGYVMNLSSGALEQRNLAIGVVVPFGPHGIRASYTRVTGEGGAIEGNDADQIALGYTYDFSRRTSVYATIARVTNDRLAAFAVASSPTMVAGRDSRGYEFGVRHSF